MNIAPDLFAARYAYATLAADATVLGLIPAGGGAIRMYPDVAPSGATSPFLTYGIGDGARIATPMGRPPAMVTVAFDITAWKQHLAKEPLDDLVIAVQAALCGPDLRGRKQPFEGRTVTVYYGGPVPVRADASDAGEWTRSATRYFVEIAGTG